MVAERILLSKFKQYEQKTPGVNETFYLFDPKFSKISPYPIAILKKNCYYDNQEEQMSATDIIRRAK
jgi:hypothetical protein